MKYFHTILNRIIKNNHQETINLIGFFKNIILRFKNTVILIY
jgi:hypothetical protein